MLRYESSGMFLAPVLIAGLSQLLQQDAAILLLQVQHLHAQYLRDVYLSIWFLGCTSNFSIEFKFKPLFL